MKWHILLTLVAALLGPERTHTQGEPPPALRVTIRDAADQPVAGADITVTDVSGAHIFARVTTDAAGAAEVPSLPGGDVRVWVGGRTGDVILHQDGQDATGVLLVGQLPLVLALRVEPDGRVIPDPQAMLAREADGPLVATPAPAAGGAARTDATVAAPATPGVPTPAQPSPDVQPAKTDASASPTPADQPAETSASALRPEALLILACLLAAGLGLAALVLRWGRPV